MSCVVSLFWASELLWAQPKLINLRYWNLDMLYMLACWVYVYSCFFFVCRSDWFLQSVTVSDFQHNNNTWLINSMKRSYQAVVTANSGHTRYWCFIFNKFITWISLVFPFVYYSVCYHQTHWCLTIRRITKTLISQKDKIHV